MEKERKLSILAIQMNSLIANKEANFKKVEDLIAQNFKKGTDVVVLPEVWTVGWKCSEFKNSAEELEKSETIEFLSSLAKKYDVNMYIAETYLSFY